MKRNTLFIFSIFILVIWGCINHPGSKAGQLQDGNWRGVLTRPDNVSIPFNFEVKDNGQILFIKNSNDSIKVANIRYQGDSVFIQMPYFNSEFLTQLQNDGSLNGIWVQRFPDTNRSMTFQAQPNTSYRFRNKPQLTKYNLSGRWRTSFARAKDTSMAVGIFRQNGKRITGTFLADFDHDRYLEGIVNGDSIQLSTFDGTHVFLFKGWVKNDSAITNGIFYSGFAGEEKWSAKRDSTARLGNPLDLTTYKPGKNRLNFSFPDLKGNTISIQDKRFKNKVVIVQLMGTWCANCLEETRFLSQWYRNNKNPDIAIIGLCYERTSQFKKAVKDVMTFKKGLNVPYPLLITGVALTDPHLMEKTLPQLKHFVNFPTLIFLNKKGKIAKIYAGASGPSSEEYFKAYKRTFNHIIDSLTRE